LQPGLKVRELGGLSPPALSSGGIGGRLREGMRKRGKR